MAVEFDVVSEPLIVLDVQPAGDVLVTVEQIEVVFEVVDSGPAGPAGPTGATGPGVPAGGTTGQVLAKVDADDYDTQWIDAPGGAVDSVNTQTGDVVLDAGDIAIVDTAGDFTATDVEGALAELQSDHETDAQNLTDHLNDTSDAHDASAISNVAAGNIIATNVQAALNELDTEKIPWAGGTNPVSGSSTTYTNASGSNSAHWKTDTTGGFPSAELKATAGSGANSYVSVGAVGSANRVDIWSLGTDRSALLQARGTSAKIRFTISNAGGTGLGGTADLFVSSGSPEGVLSSAQDNFCLDSANGAIYVKTTASGNTGWQRLARVDELPDLASHLNDTSDAHDASAISVLDTGGNFTATDVEAALAELVGMTGGASVTISATAPGTPGDGDLWFDTDDGSLSVWWNTEGYWVAVGGGSSEFSDATETLKTVAAAGATETLDIGEASAFDVTLDENVTFTFAGTTSGVACSFTLITRQDGSGGNSITWPASVDWAGGTAPTLSTAAGVDNVFTFLTVDNGTTWLGFAAGLDVK